MFTYELNVHMAYNFNCIVETEGLLKLTGSRVHWKSVLSWKRCKLEMLLLQTTKSDMAYYCYYYYHFMAPWTVYGTTLVSRYQKR